MKDLKMRVISAVVFVAVMLLFLYLGNTWYDLLLFVLSLIAIYELKRCFSKIDINVSIVVSIAAAAFVFLSKRLPYINVAVLIPIVFMLILIYWVLSPKVKFNDALMTIFVVIYSPVLFSLLNKVDNVYCKYLFYIIPYSCDTFAYFTGCLFGKHKFFPSVSPKKTVEGVIGGIVFSVLITTIFCKVFIDASILRVVVMAVICSIVSVLSDLISSKIKRVAGIKDFGNIMPGHGGILDRFDSVLGTAPFILFILYGFVW